MNNGQHHFAALERDFDLAASGDVVWNKVKHLFEDAKGMKVAS